MAEKLAGRGSQSLFGNPFISNNPIMEPTRNEPIKPRLMTPEEEAESRPLRDALEAAVMSPLPRDPALSKQYPGELIAWSPDGSRMIGHAKDEEAIQKILAASGEDPGLCYVQFIDDRERI